MKNICLLFFAFIATSTPASATSFRLFPFNEELSVFLQSYLQDPQPEGAIERLFAVDLERFEQLAVETEHPHARSVLMAFYVQIMNRNPTLTLRFAERLCSEGKPIHSSFGTDVIAASTTNDRDKALALIIAHFDLPPEEVSNIEAKETFDYLGLAADHPHTLDVLWACYFASGESLFVESIVHALNGQPVGREDAQRRIRELGSTKLQPGSSEYELFWSLVVGEAARMGLFFNTRDDDGVRGILVRLVSDSAAPTNPILRSILDSANQQESEPRHGPLNHPPKRTARTARLA